MPHISSKKLKKETLNRLYSEFGKALEKSAQKSGTKFFIGDLLTKTEKIMLAKRFAIIYLLSQDVPISYIVESLGVSYPTLSRMSLKYDIGKYSSLLKTLGEKDKTNIWDMLEKILRAGLPPRAGRGRWKFLYDKK
ncbi:MAG: Trp family transcriptional regulator [Patescibacteria group bacterium]